MSESEMEGKDGIVNGDVEAERVRFENQRMTRRQALRKFGFTAGMMVFATLSVDDLARIAARKLQETEMTKGIGDTLAKEFRDAGVALATPEAGNPYGAYYAAAGTDPCYPGGGVVANCEECQNDRYQKCIEKKGLAGAEACRNIETNCEAFCLKYGDATGASAVANCWAIAGIR